jgi:LacI family transcriptional regulator
MNNKKKPKYVTLNYISEITGYSRPTISRVINGHKYIKKETRDKIISVINELNYKPEWTARSLRTGKTNLIAIIFKDIANFFTTEVIASIQEVLSGKRKDIILFNTNFDKGLENEYLEVAISKRVDGIILASMGMANVQLINSIITKNEIPIVIIDNDIKDVNVDKVFHDNVVGAKILTEHLISHGHKRIAIISPSLRETSAIERIEGYKIALKNNSIEINEDYIKSIKFKEEKFFEKIKERISELFSYTQKPTAIFIASTNLAIGTLSYLKENNYKIPGDIALVSFDDHEFVNIMNPPLTTLKSINKEIGTVAANLLLKKIKGGAKKEAEVIKIGSKLIVRDSCGCNSKN